MVTHPSSLLHRTEPEYRRTLVHELDNMNKSVSYHANILPLHTVHKIPTACLTRTCIAILTTILAYLIFVQKESIQYLMYAIIIFLLFEMFCMYMENKNNQAQSHKSAEEKPNELKAKVQKLKARLERSKDREARSKAKIEKLADENTTLRKKLTEASNILCEQSEGENELLQADAELQLKGLHVREEDLDKTICQEKHVVGRVTLNLGHLNTHRVVQTVIGTIQKRLPEFASKMPPSLEGYLTACKSGTDLLYVLEAMILLEGEVKKVTEELNETKRFWSTSPYGQMILRTQADVASQSDTESSQSECY